MTLPNQNQQGFRRRVLKSRRTARAVAKTLRNARSHSPFSRRKFMRQAAGAGLLAALAPTVSKPQSENTAARRTLFFNLFQEDSLANSDSTRRKTYFFNIGGNRYRLKRVGRRSRVLARARETNAFLRAIPENQITHYIENFVVSPDITALGYIGSPIDPEAGTWSMSAVVQYLSPDSVGLAYQRAREITPNGPLPQSAKRQFYGIDAGAFTAQDIADEFALVDYTDTARTLIALQPDMLCANPAGAEEIAVNYISLNSGTLFLAKALESQGPAMPQESPNQQNTQGWATLIPLKQEDGSPFKMEDGLNQYFPDWSAAVDAQVGRSISALVPQVKNDVSLGSDITNLPPDSNAPYTASIQQQLTGKVWYRRDGVTAVDHGSAAYLNSAPPKWDFHQKNGETGLQVTQPGVTISPDGRVEITFDNVANWFFRSLGAYVQFVDRDDNVIPAGSLPPDTLPARSPGLMGLDRGNALYAGIVPPVFSLAGIPIYPPGEFSFPVNLPTEAGTVNLFYAGLGLSGSAIGPDHVTDVGFGLTLAVNFGLVALFMAAGVPTVSDTVESIIAAADVIVSQLLTVLGSVLNSESPSLVDAGVTLMEGFLNGLIQRDW